MRGNERPLPARPVGLAVGSIGLVLLLPGAALALDLPAIVVGTVPADAKGGGAAAGSGSAWSAVAALIAFALFVTAIIGPVVVARRRRRPRISVYETIQHRIDEERRAAQERRPAQGPSTTA